MERRKIRRFVEKANDINGEHIHYLAYEDNCESADFGHSDIWEDIEKKK